MLQINDFAIDLVETPGLIHVDNLTTESARETTILLKENNARYHIFSTTEDDKGVRRVCCADFICIADARLRFTYTITLSTIR